MKITNVINSNVINTSVISWLGGGGGGVGESRREKDEKVIEKESMAIPSSSSQELSSNSEVKTTTQSTATSGGQRYGIINGFHHNQWQNSFSHLRSRVPPYYPSMIVREPLIPYHVPTQISTNMDSSVARHDINHDYYGFVDYSRF